MLKDTKPESVSLFYHICITYINQFLLLKTEKFYKMLGVFGFRMSAINSQFMESERIEIRRLLMEEN